MTNALQRQNPFDETHIARQIVAQQAYDLEKGGYLLRIENANASGEDLVNISVNIVPEFRFGITAMTRTMVFTATIFVTKCGRDH
jgi:hypothetical protein